MLLSGPVTKVRGSVQALLCFPFKGLRERRGRGEGASRGPGEKHEAEQRSQIGEVVGGGDQPADARSRARAGGIEELQEPSLEAEEMIQRLRIDGSLGTSPDWFRERCATGRLEAPDGTRRDRGPALRRMKIFVPGAGDDAVHLNRVDGLTTGRAVGPKQTTVPRAGEDWWEAPGKPPGPAVALLDLAPVPGETLRAIPGRSSQQPRVVVDHPRGATARGEPLVHRPVPAGEREVTSRPISSEERRVARAKSRACSGSRSCSSRMGMRNSTFSLRPPVKPVGWRPPLAMFRGGARGEGCSRSAPRRVVGRDCGAADA